VTLREVLSDCREAGLRRIDELFEQLVPDCRRRFEQPRNIRQSRATQRASHTGQIVQAPLDVDRV
jgi:hypothetical protein